MWQDSGMTRSRDGRPGRRALAALARAAAVGSLLGSALVVARLVSPAGEDRDRALELSGVPYGPHPLQVLDLWVPPGEAPRPLVVWVHGGGFFAGDKGTLPAARRTRLLAAGLAVAAVNYRLTPEVSFPAPHRDVARAIQTLRYQASAWGLDPERVAGLGHSAGGGILLWLAFHDDLADGDAPDPVARRSTRLAAVAALDSQSSYDPFFAEAIGLPRLDRHSFFRPFYGLGPDDPVDTPALRRRYREASAVTWLSADDPPVWMGFKRLDLAVGPATRLADIVHHPRFGIDLCGRMTALGIECELSYRGREPAVEVEEWLAARLAARLGVAR